MMTSCFTLRLPRTAGVYLIAVMAAAGWFHSVSATPRPTPLTPVVQAGPAPDARSMTLALTGDSIITMKLAVHTEPQFVKMIDLIRGADAAFTNLEMLFHDYEPYPSTQSGGTYMRADPALVKELVWAGFDMVARANNHTNDYGVEGARLTTKYVADAGLVQAGVGESLREAREARYLDTDKGRVALISTASTFPDPSRAGVSWGDTKARPGLNPLRFRTTTVLTRQQFDALRTALGAAGQLGGRGGQGTPGTQGAGQPATEMTVFDRRFVVGDAPGVRSEPLKEDVEGMAAVVRNASRQADYVIVSSHTHEGGTDRFTPPEFFVTFAHAMVDAGADVIAVSGPHVLRGIELYKGKPIFYSLANFIFENETLLRQPPENYEPLGMPQGSGVADFNDRRSNNDTIGFPADPYIWESVIALPTFTGRQLTGLKLYPIALGFKKPRTERGWPMFAGPELARKIIDDVARLSAPFGTKVELRDGIGIVGVETMKSNQ
jgi:poly-gamma-glutamate capsule biosynthesis protein CapA/YwtB (metallophosphatase superfamily)